MWHNVVRLPGSCDDAVEIKSYLFVEVTVSIGSFLAVSQMPGIDREWKQETEEEKSEMVEMGFCPVGVTSW